MRASRRLRRIGRIGASFFETASKRRAPHHGSSHAIAGCSHSHVRISRTPAFDHVGDRCIVALNVDLAYSSNTGFTSSTVARKRLLSADDRGRDRTVELAPQAASIGFGLVLRPKKVPLTPLVIYWSTSIATCCPSEALGRAGTRCGQPDQRSISTRAYLCFFRWRAIGRFAGRRRNRNRPHRAMRQKLRRARQFPNADMAARSAPASFIPDLVEPFLGPFVTRRGFSFRMCRVGLPM